MSETSHSQSSQARLWAVLPLIVFLGLAGLALFGMFGNRVDRHASPLIGKPAPAFMLPALSGGTVELQQFRGRPIILNVFASWCAPCRVEHPQLLQLSKDSRFVVLGLAYRDEPAKTAKFIEELGNPFAAIALDRQGATGVQFGLAGVPETYVIGADGIVLHRHQGEVTPKVAADLARIATARLP
jgi:cytochrome c biogenesis protein CcmG, thiol:disulfide interchange protein DsbE